MDTTELEDLKRRIDAYGRKPFSEKLGMTYGVLSHKLNGFSGFTDKELEFAKATLDLIAPEGQGE